MTSHVPAYTRRAAPSRGRLRQALTLAAWIALLALALAGCTGAPAPSASTAPSPTVSPTPSYKQADDKGKAQNVPVPVIPAEAKAHTKEGLQAFMKHWVGLASYAYETGDTNPLFDVTGAGCKTCNDLKVTLEATYGRGGWVSGGTLQFASAESPMIRNQYGQIAGVVQFKQDEIAFRNEDGTIRTKFDADLTPAAKLFLVVERDGGWELGDVGNAPKATP
ncbi:DUF6318 family protein [Arthrobacter sp. NA-172]|uniref:DUF6318 family protein n=1 Tax=Arthrobacter sp. NA-172 TaxID=3367524 RepID=UPI0037540DFD